MEDGSGFRIEQTGDLIYPYDPFDGWYDKYENYYECKEVQIKDPDGNLYWDKKIIPVKDELRPIYEKNDSYKNYLPYMDQDDDYLTYDEFEMENNSPLEEQRGNNQHGEYEDDYKQDELS